MERVRPFVFLALIASVTLAGHAAASASDWTRWRGPGADGIAAETDMFGGDAFGLDVEWSRPLGIAYSGIAVADGRLLTMFGDGGNDYLVAIDAGKGEEIWRYRIDTMFPSIGGSEGGPVSMPVVDGGRVFGLGAKGHLFAVRLDDGEEVWATRIDESLGGVAPHFGFTTTPLVVDGALFVQTGGPDGRAFTAFDKESGKVLWSTGDDKVGYQSPAIATVAGRRQILAVGNTTVFGLDPATGETLWSYAHGDDGSDDGHATPVLLDDDRILLPGMSESVALDVRLDETRWVVTEAWRTQSFKRSFAVPVLYEGHLYGFDADFLTCVNPADGKRVWKSRPPGGRGLVVADGHLVVFASDGSVVVADASPDGYRERARVPVSETGSYTWPSVAGGRIYVRNTVDLASIRVGKAASSVSEESRGPARSEFERFVRGLADSRDKRLLLDEFMKDQDSFPVVETGWVHFVYRGEADDVAVTGTMTEYDVEESMLRVDGTDLFYRSYEIEPGSRVEYRYNVDFDNEMPDPLNPRRVPSDEGDRSEVTTGWVEPEHVRPYRGTERGGVETFRHASDALENEREISVYLPAGYDSESSRGYPLLVVNDAEWMTHASLPNTLDHLTGRSVEPMVVAIVERLPGQAARDEYGGSKSDAYVAMLADELVPALAKRYRLLEGAENRAVLGVGSGALMAAYAALERPDTFGNAAVQSFYARGDMSEAIHARVGELEASKPRFWVTWGRHDLHRKDWGIDFRRDSRELFDALRGGGFRVSGGEMPDGGGWGGWRASVAIGLAELFPAGGGTASR